MLKLYCHRGAEERVDQAGPAVAPVVEDSAPGFKQSPSLTPVLVSSLEVKGMEPHSLLEVLGLSSAVGFPLEI